MQTTLLTSDKDKSESGYFMHAENVGLWLAWRGGSCKCMQGHNDISSMMWRAETFNSIPCFLHQDLVPLLLYVLLPLLPVNF